MTDVYTFEGEDYLKTTEASRLVGYSPDYVTKLAREQKINARQVGRYWYIEPDSLKLFSLTAEAEKRKRKGQLREERIKERAVVFLNADESTLLSQIKKTKFHALAQTGVIAVCLFIVCNLVWSSLESRINVPFLFSGLTQIGSELSEVMLEPIPNFLSQVASYAFIKVPIDEPRAVVFDPTLYDKVSSEESDFQGVVVFEENAEKTRVAIDEIKEAFSDEVNIEFKNHESVLITPVFREHDGDTHRFLLIPASPLED
ncbi:helix-turn-helix domain-containing protein [Candidatus Pacebacteria bacterium]|nr:helix-turn-helix domain-containing protein [Candidatus Paceibacterota bacterium]